MTGVFAACVQSGVFVVNSKVHQPCKTGDRLLIFKDHDIKGRSVLFDSSVPVENSQQKEPAAVRKGEILSFDDNSPIS